MKTIKTKYLTRALQFLAIGTTLSSCFAPVNLNFESSRMMEKNDMEVQVSCSNYSVQNSFNSSNNGLVDQSTYQQQNVAAKIGFGVTDKYNIKTKFEGIFTPANNNVFRTIFFFEIDNKIKLNKYAAISLPIGLYSLPVNNKAETNSFTIFQFDPRIYLTYAPSDKFEFSVIPKCHIASLYTAIPGISIGAGFSSNLNEWAIRPERGIDATSFSAGISFSKILKAKR